MLFELNECAFVDGQYIAASAQFPVKVSLPDDRPDLVSVQWRALDDSARKAQDALARQKKVKVVTSVGRSQVAVAGGKKVTGVAVIEQEATPTPVVEIGKQNPIGA